MLFYFTLKQNSVFKCRTRILSIESVIKNKVIIKFVVFCIFFCYYVKSPLHQINQAIIACRFWWAKKQERAASSYQFWSISQQIQPSHLYRSFKTNVIHLTGRETGIYTCFLYSIICCLLRGFISELLNDRRDNSCIVHISTYDRPIMSRIISLIGSLVYYIWAE